MSKIVKELEKKLYKIQIHQIIFKICYTKEIYIYICIKGYKMIFARSEISVIIFKCIKC